MIKYILRLHKVPGDNTTKLLISSNDMIWLRDIIPPQFQYQYTPIVPLVTSDEQQDALVGGETKIFYMGNEPEEDEIVTYLGSSYGMEVRRASGVEGIMSHSRASIIRMMPDDFDEKTLFAICRREIKHHQEVILKDGKIIL